MFLNKSFGSYLPDSRSKLDYRAIRCPNSDLICEKQGIWIEQSVFLGPKCDMHDIADAFVKVFENRAALATWARTNSIARGRRSA